MFETHSEIETLDALLAGSRAGATAHLRASVSYTEGETLGVWTHGHVTTLNPVGGPDDPAWPEVLTHLTRHYGGSPFE
jgi:hypothetical protein